MNGKSGGITKDWTLTDRWYTVKADRFIDDAARTAMDHWCDNNCIGYFILDGNVAHWEWYFADAQDYVLFMLLWGDALNEIS